MKKFSLSILIGFIANNLVGTLIAMFIRQNCGLVNSTNKCRCHKKIDDAINNQFINPENLLFVKNTETKKLIETIETIQDEVNLHQTNPNYETPKKLLIEIKKAIAIL